MKPSVSPGQDGPSLLRRLLDDGRPHLMDGAMGTMLYEHGVFLNVCYDDLNRSRPELVTSIHEAYLQAGAEILETNTFGANPVKLSAFRLEDDTEAINAAGVRCARDAIARHRAQESQRVGPEACVVGAIGPLGLRIEPWGATSFAEAQALFSRQIRGLLDGGVDGFLLETFQDLGELEQAVLAVRACSDLPVMVQMTLTEGGRTALGTPVSRMIDALDALGVDALGFNCSAGPAEVLEAVEEAAERTQRPILAQPNAGLPRSVGDRTIYLASPDYMARYARRMLEAGARFLGGCCGTTPEHIRALRGVLDAGRPADGPRIEARSREPTTTGSVPREKGLPEGGLAPAQETFRSLLNGGGWLCCVERAPHAGWRPDELLAEARRLHEAGVDVLAIPDPPRGVAQIPAGVAAVLVQETVGMVTLPHYTARDRILMDMVSDLMGLAAGGVHQVLLKSGDPSPTGPYPDPSHFSEVDAIGLTHAVHRLNSGMAPGGGAIEPPCPLMPGIRLNQVSPDPARARSRYRYKVEAGAGFALTQPVYDATLLQAFLEDNGEHRIPVLAVLRPLGSTEEAEFLANEVPGHEVPASVRSRLAEAEARGGPAAAKEEGVRITLEILEALMVDAPWTDWIRGIYLTGQTPVTELTSIVQAIRQREAQAVRNPHA